MIERIPWVCAWAALVLLAGIAGAQQTEYELNEDGDWEQVSAPDPESEAGALAEAKRLLAEDKPKRALRAIEPFLERYERREHELLPEALLVRADANMMLRHEITALRDYEAIIERFPGTDVYVRAIERELDLAVRYVNGYRRKFLGVRVLAADDIGEELLIRVQERLPGSQLAERAGLELGEYYYRQRDLSMAAEMYRLFLENYPQSSYRATAMRRRVYAAIGQYKGPKYDSSPLLDARVLIQMFMATLPGEADRLGLNEALLARLDESAGAEMLESALWYLRVDDPPAARVVMRRLIARYPFTVAAAEAEQMMVERGWLAPSEERNAVGPTPGGDG